MSNNNQAQQYTEDRARSKFFFTPSAIEDFQDIFAKEKFDYNQTLTRLINGSENAKLVRIKSDGTTVWKLNEKDGFGAFIIAGQAYKQFSFPPIMAVGPPNDNYPLPQRKHKPSRWWLYDFGDLFGEKQ